MTITTLEKMEIYRRAEDLAEKAVEFVTDYIAEVAKDEDKDVTQQAIYIAGRLLAPAHNGTYFRMPALDDD